MRVTKHDLDGEQEVNVGHGISVIAKCEVHLEGRGLRGWLTCDVREMSSIMRWDDW